MMPGSSGPRTAGRVGGDGGQVLYFALFLLVFVVLLVVGESMVLLARFREEGRLMMEAESRHVADWAVGSMNDLADEAWDLYAAITTAPAGGGTPVADDRWRSLGGGACADAAGLALEPECWQIASVSKSSGTAGLAGAADDILEVTVRTRSGCAVGADALDVTPSWAGSGCASGEEIPLKFKRRSFLRYVLHYDTHTTPPRWQARNTRGDPIETAFYAKDATSGERDVITGAVHANLAEVLVCGKPANAMASAGRIETDTAGTYKDVCSTHSGGSLPGKGGLPISALVTDTGEPAPACGSGGSGNTDWLRDARRPAEAGSAGWQHLAGGSTISLATLDAHTDTVYATGDLTVTSGTVTRAVTLIAEGDIILQNDTPLHTQADAGTFAAAGADRDGRLHVLALIAGCDIVIDYRQTPTPPRPKQPPDPDPNLHSYPTHRWGTTGHTHYYRSSTSRGWDKISGISCGIGNCDSSGYTAVGGDSRTWWLQGGNYIDRATFDSIKDEWDDHRNSAAAAGRRDADCWSAHPADPDPSDPDRDRNETARNGCIANTSFTFTDHDGNGHTLTAALPEPTGANAPEPQLAPPISCTIPTSANVSGVTGGLSGLAPDFYMTAPASVGVKISPPSGMRGFYGTSHSWEVPTSAACDAGGVSWSVDAAEYHPEGWSSLGWSHGRPPDPDGWPHSPASYPYGIADGSSAAYSIDGSATDPGDDDHCASWKQWEMTPQRQVWNAAPAIPDPPQATLDLDAGRTGNTVGSGHHENHSITSAADHGPLPPRGDIIDDYTQGTDVLRATPPLAIGEDYATDHWPAYRMREPGPLHELCDFMDFTLSNVAILAPTGGVIARDWAIPRQQRSTPLPANDPVITIEGSIAVKHRGLFGQYDNAGALATGYRKVFTHPAGFAEGVTAWWPELKQNHWTPL